MPGLTKSILLIMFVFILGIIGCASTTYNYTHESLTKYKKPVLDGNLLFVNIGVGKDVYYMQSFFSSPEPSKYNIWAEQKSVIQDSVIASVDKSNLFDNNKLVNYSIIGTIEKFECFSAGFKPEYNLWINYSLMNMDDNKVVFNKLIKSHTIMDEFIFSGLERYKKSFYKAVKDNTKRLVDEIYQFVSKKKL